MPDYYIGNDEVASTTKTVSAMSFLKKNNKNEDIQSTNSFFVLAVNFLGTNKHSMLIFYYMDSEMVILPEFSTEFKHSMNKIIALEWIESFDFTKNRRTYLLVVTVTSEVYIYSLRIEDTFIIDSHRKMISGGSFPIDVKLHPLEYVQSNMDNSQNYTLILTQEYSYKIIQLQENVNNLDVINEIDSDCNLKQSNLGSLFINKNFLTYNRQWALNMNFIHDEYIVEFNKINKSKLENIKILLSFNNNFVVVFSQDLNNELYVKHRSIMLHLFPLKSIDIKISNIVQSYATNDIEFMNKNIYALSVYMEIKLTMYIFKSLVKQINNILPDTIWKTLLYTFTDIPIDKKDKWLLKLENILNYQLYREQLCNIEKIEQFCCEICKFQNPIESIINKVKINCFNCNTYYDICFLNKLPIIDNQEKWVCQWCKLSFIKRESAYEYFYGKFKTCPFCFDLLKISYIK